MTVPAVDPEIQMLLDTAAAAATTADTADTGVFPVHGLAAVLADPQRYALLRAHPDTPADDQVKACDLYIPGPPGQLRLRVYRPGTPEDLPMILYVHGGAYTYGSPEAEEKRSLRYARYARDARAVSPRPASANATSPTRYAPCARPFTPDAQPAYGTKRRGRGSGHEEARKPVQPFR
ncbi:alpha/beta hydrolase family protein [Streptomyces aureocirculatus]|uniref:hypothetical protein n=1 Tax=Streptomyces aureocirculatus TaxID=67275 RepID=UPI0004C49639|nr:hypothetical protein [Streptomyces aureocirculatus]